MSDMFAIPIPVLEKVLRPIFVYIFLVVLLRMFGKRELAQLNPFDLVVLLSLSNTVQNAIIGDDNSLAGGLIGAFTLVFINYVVVRFLFRHRRLDQIMEGKPTVLIRDGHVRKNELAKELLSVHELQTVIQRQGYQGIHEVESCILEPGGAFVMKGKVPSEAEQKHTEVISGIAAIRSQLEKLEARLA